MTTRKPLRPPPEPTRTSIPLSQLVEIDRRELRHNLAATYYGRPPTRRGSRS